LGRLVELRDEGGELGPRAVSGILAREAGRLLTRPQHTAAALARNQLLCRRLNCRLRRGGTSEESEENARHREPPKRSAPEAEECCRSWPEGGV
jgi:hypothetical protein